MFRLIKEQFTETQGSRPPCANKSYTLRPDAPSWVPHVLDYGEEMDANLKVSKKKPTLVDGIETDEDIENKYYNRNMKEKSPSEPGDLHKGVEDIDHPLDTESSQHLIDDRRSSIRSQSLPDSPRLNGHRTSLSTDDDITIDDSISNSKKLSVSSLGQFSDTSPESTSPSVKLDDKAAISSPQPLEITVNMQFEPTMAQTSHIRFGLDALCVVDEGTPSFHSQDIDEDDECNVRDNDPASGANVDHVDDVGVDPDVVAEFSPTDVVAEFSPTDVIAEIHPTGEQMIEKKTGDMTGHMDHTSDDLASGKHTKQPPYSGNSESKVSLAVPSQRHVH